ncbi:FecR family protein [Echinicola sp. 20G]|uniref:FecR family protein n=1 Tax=Echinicola sp. 20G TaxID=2781961 RepID=UPI0019106E01|nr:FecR family protein [Echinicola sp. 20G]
MDYNQRIKDFYEGKLSRDQVLEFLEFLESPEAEEHLSIEVISLWISKIKNSKYKWDNRAVWGRIQKGMKGYPKSFIQKSIEPTNFIKEHLWKAAILVFMIGLTTLFFVRNPKNFLSHPALEETLFVTKVNPRGEKTKVTLEDGSVVYLNSESSITYAENFRENRKIQLEGEAFFEVTKDQDHPFSVDAKGIITTALGTSFNISTFNKQQKVTVTLVTGKVKLNQKGKSAFLELQPGEESHLSIYEKEMEKYTVSVSDRILWTKGILKFDMSSFQEMVEILERWYGVDISFEGTPNNIKASGEFDQQESLRNVLEVMSKSLEFDFELHNKSVKINFK